METKILCLCLFGWIQEDAKMNDADADAAKADTEVCEDEGQRCSSWNKYVSEWQQSDGWILMSAARVSQSVCRQSDGQTALYARHFSQMR